MDPSVAFIDTSAWFAFKDLAAPDHQRAIDFVAAWAGDLVTSNFVVDETITLARYRLGYTAALELGESLWSQELAGIVQVSSADEQAAWALFKRYRDKRFSFTDCTSFVVMQRLGLTYAFAFDDDFSQVGRFVKVPG